MGQINPEHLKALLPILNSSPYFKLLNMEICELGTGYSKILVQLEEKHHNPFGGIHGGVYASVIDTAAYWAAYCDMEEDAGFTSVDVCVNNLSMMKEKMLIAEGKIIKIGKNICLCEAYATDQKGKLIAQGTSKLMVLKGRQGIQDVLRRMDVAQKLPNKFL